MSWRLMRVSVVCFVFKGHELVDSFERHDGVFVNRFALLDNAKNSSLFIELFSNVYRLMIGLNPQEQ